MEDSVSGESAQRAPRWVVPLLIAILVAVVVAVLFAIVELTGQGNILLTVIP